MTTFLAVLNWLLAKAPGFIKPAVNWLVEGMRRITGVIASKWNWLGTSVGRFLAGLAAFKSALWGFMEAATTVLMWLVLSYVPGRIAAVARVLAAAIDRAVAAAIAWTKARVADVARVVADGLSLLAKALAMLRVWASVTLDALIARLAALLRALAPVLSGPAFLAEWLVAPLWKAALRLAYGQRDRITLWLLQGSPSFTQWLATTVENLLIRWLS